MHIFIYIELYKIKFYFLNENWWNYDEDAEGERKKKQIWKIWWINLMKCKMKNNTIPQCITNKKQTTTEESTHIL